MNVHILLTIRKPELLEASTLVFKTLRVGFPTAKVVVWRNRCRDFVAQSDPAIDWLDTDTIHHEWIEALVNQLSEPFWILDSDVHFWESVQDWKFDGPMAGRLIPQFFDEYANCIDQPRLHTALMWIDPEQIKRKTSQYRSQFPKDGFNPGTNLFHPTYLPIRKGKNLFFDTMSLLYHAIGGQAFAPWQLDAFEHMNFGTISDMVLPRLKDGAELAKVRDGFLADPAKYRGNWRRQEEWYRAKKA